MTKPTPAELTPAEIVAQAEAEFLAAEQHVETIEAQITAGDEGLTPEDLDKARSVSRFAQLRRAAAARKAEKLAEKLEQARLTKVIDDNLPAAMQNVDERIDPLLAKARELLDEAINISREHDRAVFAIAMEAQSEGNPHHPENDPALVGFARPTVPQLTWFKTRGRTERVYGARTVIDRLTAPYNDIHV